MARFLSRLALAIAATLAAICCLFAATGFLIAALYIWLRSLPLSAPIAGVIVATALLLIGGLAILIAKWNVAPQRKAKPDKASPAADLGGRVVRTAVEATEAHPYSAVAVALLAGIMVGISRNLQGLLKAVLRAL